MTIEASAAATHSPLPEIEVYRLSLAGWCHGLGIEIGALHNPQRGLAADADILYVDKASTKQLIDLFQSEDSVPRESIVPVDVVGDAIRLPIRESALDFLIAHNVLEHMPNPVATIREWHRTLREGGRLYISVPDKRFYSIDSERALTTWRHLADDSQRNDDGYSDASREHLLEWVRYYEGATPDEVDSHVNRYLSTGRDYHYHTWTHESLLLTFHRCAKELGLGFRRVAELSSYETAGETLLVLEKDSSLRAILPAQFHFPEWRVDRMDFAPGEMLPAEIWEQSFTCTRNGLNSVHVRFGTFARMNSGAIRFRLYRQSSGMPYAEETLDVSALFDNSFHAFCFAPVIDSASERLRFTLEALEGSSGNAVTAWCARLSRPELRFTLNESEQSGASLNFKAFCLATLDEDNSWQERSVEPYIHTTAHQQRLLARLRARVRALYPWHWATWRDQKSRS